jgi:hypothetical protein
MLTAALYKHSLTAVEDTQATIAGFSSGKGLPGAVGTTTELAQAETPAVKASGAIRLYKFLKAIFIYYLEQ